MSTGTGTGV